MKHSIGDGTGYIQIDHRNSPGLSADDVAAVPGALAVPEGTQVERDIAQCSHCQRAVVLNPGRVRTRAVCPKCYHFICDSCETARIASGGACVPFKQVLDRAATIVEKFEAQPDHPDAQIVLEDLQAPPEPKIVLASS